MIDSSSTHNFIHCKIAKDLDFFLYPTPKCQVMVVDGGTKNFSRKCHNINLTIGEFVLNIPMLVILMGGFDVVLRVHWLQSLGT
ncbi:retropepsin-like aspartic protease, partial [Enterococcus faecium]|uniref:retropepsin-like aspartic protease n=1 Tax=Enterococcus faecium TaxID=1352 RepID=UPI00387DCD03